MKDIMDMNLATRLVHAGEDDYALGAIAPPVFETASFRLENFAARSRVTELPSNTTFYSGISNPTVAALEVKLAAIESAETALAFNSGMAAITTTILTICRNGGHVIVSDKLFIVTDHWFREDLPALGCEVTVADFLDLSEVERSFQPNTRAVFFEEFTNPQVIALDLDSIIRLAHAHGALAIVDNTYGSPALFRPIEHGADLVLHSATKYMSGHGRYRAGALAGSHDLIAPIAQLRVNMGTIASPHSAAGITEGLRTLDLRVGRASSTALRLAQLADDHEATAAVQYPGLPGSMGHEHAARLTGGRYGGMLSLKLANPTAGAAVYDAFDVIVRATSLGDGVSLVDYWPAQDLFRISTGIEDPDDLAEDLGKALNAALLSSPGTSSPGNHRAQEHRHHRCLDRVRRADRACPRGRENRTLCRPKIDNIHSSPQVSDARSGIFDVTGHLRSALALARAGGAPALLSRRSALPWEPGKRRPWWCRCGMPRSWPRRRGWR